jgi:hypothetical protein
MKKSEQYAANARECLRMAEAAGRSDQRRTWLWLGESWLAMVTVTDKTKVH